MAEKQEITAWNMIKNMFNLSDFVQENVTTEADIEKLRDITRLVASDYSTALWGFPMPNALGELATGELGDYHGQYISSDDFNPPSGKSPEQYQAELNHHYGIKEAPNLRDTYLGYTTPEDQDMAISPYEPSGGYPFSDGPLYDATDYIAFTGFSGNQETLNKLVDDINALKEDEIINLSNRDDIFIGTHRSIDLGNSSNWSIGIEDGKPYLAIADEWDFIGPSSQTGGDIGEIMEMLKIHPLNFYGGFPIYNDDFKSNLYYE